MAESKPLSVRLPDKVYADLERVCASTGISKSSFVVEAVAWALENEASAAVHVPLAVQEAQMVVTKSGRVRMPARREMPRLGGARSNF